MMTSFEELELAERFIFEQLGMEDRLVYEARLLTNPGLRINVFFQRKVYQIVKLFNRRQVKRQFEGWHNQIFKDPSEVDYQQEIFKLF